MAKSASSGISLTKSDARLILGMDVRGDRNHDIAAWFGVNQGRIAEVKNGDYGTLEVAPASDLPPSGPPGIKGRRLRHAVGKALLSLNDGEDNAFGRATKLLSDAVSKYDANET